MYHKKIYPDVMCFAALSVLLAVSPWTAAAQGGSGCVPSGVHMGYGDVFGGMYWSITTIPLDPQGDRLLQHVHFMNAEPTFGGLFPTAKTRDLFNLELVRTGPNTWSYSAIGHGFGEIQPGVACGPLAYLIIESGTMTSSEDCEVITHDGTFAFYMPYQDVNPKDGVPDEGEQPVLCIPVNRAQRRLAVKPPSLPVFPETALPVLGDVWVTDNLQSTQNLVGGTDEDLDSERALAVRWYLDDRDCQSYHIYISVDGGPYQYLCHTVDRYENKLEWKAGRRAYLNPAFIDGPQYGHAYAFQVYTVTASGKPFSLGPFATKGAVTLVAPSVEAQNVELIRTFIEEFTNKKNLDYANQVLAPDIVDNLSGVGVEAFKYVWSGFFSAFPDFHMTSEDLFAIGDIVVNRALMTGTHLGNFIYGDLKIPPTGAQVTMTGISVYQIKEGKVVAHWAEADMEGMMQQIGVMPKTRDFFGWTAPSTVTGAPGDPQANIALVLRETEMWNSMDFSRIGEIYSDRVVFHIPPYTFSDLEGYRKWANTTFAQFPGAQLTYHEGIYAAGDRVVGRWDWSGTLAPMGRKLTEGGTSILRIAGGKVVEVWWNADSLGVGLQMMAPLNEAEMRILAANFYKAFNAHDLTALSQLWTDDLVYDFVASPPVMHGKEEAVEFFESDVFVGFPDFHAEAVHELVSPGNQLLVRDALVTGTQLGEISGIPPTGKQCAVRYLIMLEFAGNAISSFTEYLDMGSMMIQLGVMPAPAIPPLVPSFTLPDPVPTELSPLESVQALLGFWENKDISHFMEKVHPEGQFMTVMGAPLDRAALAGLLEHFISSAPDMHNEIGRIVELNDGWAVAEVVMTGTNTGSYLGLPPSGKPFELRYAALYHFDDDGLLTNFELYYDQVTLLRQLGFLQ